MATFSSMMINVGVNLSSLGTGLAQAKGQLASFNAIGSQVGSNLTSSFGRTAGAIALISGAVYAMQQAFSGAIAAADEYRLATINIAATMTDWMDKPIKDQEDFNDHLVYAQEMYKVLELEAVKHFASGKDLQLAWTIMTQKGVQLRFEEVGALGMVVDKIKLATQGQMSTIQIAQEIRSLLNGQARTTDQIALLLKDKYGKAWKEIVNEQRKSGTLLQWLSEEWDGLRQAQIHILNTLEAQSTTLWTMIRRVGREGLAGAYQYIVDVLKDINKYLIEHEQQISQKISKAWGALEPTITAIGQAILRMITYVWGSGDAFVTAAGYILFFTEAVIRAGEAFFGFIEAHAWILKIVIAFMALNAAVGIISAISLAATTLVISFIEVGVAIGGVIATAAGLSIVASGFVGIGIAVVALVGLIIGAISVFEQFGIAAANAINKAKGAASFATGITQEEFQRRKKSPSYRASSDSFEKVVREGVQATVPGSEILGPQYKKTYSPGTTAKVGSDEFNTAMASGRTFLAVDDKGLVRVMNAPPLTPEQSMELGKMALEGKKYKGRTEDSDKDKKGGAKSPESLYKQDLALLKAARALEIAEWKNFLSNLESVIEVETGILERRVEAGEITGSQLAISQDAWNRKRLAATMQAVRAEIAIEKELHEKRIEALAKDEKLSPDKKIIEGKKAVLEYQKKQIDLDKQAFEASASYIQKTNDLLKKQVDIRNELLGIAIDWMTKFDTTPATNKAIALLNVQRDMYETIKKLKAMELLPMPDYKAVTDQAAQLQKTLADITVKGVKIDPKITMDAINTLDRQLKAWEANPPDFIKPDSLDNARKFLDEWKKTGSVPLEGFKLDGMKEVLTEIQKIPKGIEILPTLKLETITSQAAQLQNIIGKGETGSKVINIDTKINMTPFADLDKQLKAWKDNPPDFIKPGSLEKARATLTELKASSGKISLISKDDLKNLDEVLGKLKDLPKDTKGIGDNLLGGSAKDLKAFAESLKTFATAFNLPWIVTLQDIVDQLSDPELIKEPGFLEGIRDKLVSLGPQITAEGGFQIREGPTIKAGVDAIKSGINDLVDSLMQGGADIKKVANNLFKGLFKAGLTESMKSLETFLTKAFTSLFKWLESSLGEGIGGAVAGALMTVVGIIGMILTSGKEKSSFSSSGAKGAEITSSEPVRGIVAGPTSIPIAEISVSIREAFAASENYLSQIAKNTSNLSTIGGGGGTTYAPTFNISMELAGIKSAIENAMESYFRDYLMSRAGAA